jgi:OmcA/MtrC family decaheme c-type cytochrome
MVDWTRAVAHNTARNQGDARVLIFGKNNIGQLAAIAAASMLMVSLAGCSGGSGGQGSQAPGGTGPVGPGGPGPVAAPTNIIVPTITSVSIASAPVVNFRLEEKGGAPYPGATLAGNGFRFVLAQLTPPESGGKSSAWTRLAYERSSSNNLGSLVDHGDGTYTYTFSTNVTADARYAASRTTRAALQLDTPEAGNGVYTWRPSDGATTGIESREIVTTKTCNSCHDDLEGHSNRRETQYCVVCHTPDLGGGAAYFPYMIHQIHAGKGEWGSGIEFPQAVSNCQTCHVDGDSGPAQAGNWETVPNVAACGSCHDNVNFATGENHAAGVATDDQCIECHGTNAAIDNGRLRVARVHENKQLKFSSQFKLEIVSVDGVLQDGSPGAVAGKVSPGEHAKVSIRVSNPETGAVYDILDPAGPFAGLPGATSTRLQAKVNWSNQDYSNYQSGALDRNGHLEPGYATTIDFLAGGVTDNGDGTFSKRADAPVPATKITGSGTVFLVARPALQVDADALTGDPVNAYVYVDAAGTPFAITDQAAAKRRSVINFDNCNDCHKKVGNSAHGGTYAANNDAGFVCLSCHGPDRSCPEFDAVGNPIPAPGVLDMKYMIHAIHAGNYNSCDHDLTGVTPYPGKLNNCEGCHDKGTYYPVDSTSVLGSTILNGADIANPELDANISPNKAACSGCHADDAIKSHMWFYGASLNEIGETAGGPYSPLIQQVDGTLISGDIERCGACHGKGKRYDVGVLHGVANFQYNR